MPISFLEFNPTELFTSANVNAKPFADDADKWTLA